MGIKKNGNSYEVRFSVNGESIYVGCYKDKNEAVMKYNKYRIESIKEQIYNYKNKIPINIYNLLLKRIQEEYDSLL